MVLGGGGATSRAMLRVARGRCENPKETVAGPEIPLGKDNTNGVPLRAWIACGWQQAMLQGAVWFRGCDEHRGRLEDFAARCIGQRFDWQQAQDAGMASSAPVSAGIAPIISAKSARIAIAFCRNWLFIVRNQNSAPRREFSMSIDLVSGRCVARSLRFTEARSRCASARV